jgi:hypothetical protein
MKSAITLFIVIISVNAFSQNWLKVDSVFAVSGVTVKSFSAPVFADMNNDGIEDLFLGNITDITDFFWNNSDSFPSTFSKDTSVLWSIYSGGLANTNSDYPAVVDLDNDDDLDLIISGYNGLLYYENIGTVSEPDFLKIDTIFTDVNTMIGSDAKPAFVDIDGDGDFDLFIGTGESLLGGPDPGITLGFRNTGTETNPEFTFDNTLVLGLPDIGLNAYPAFADLDNDGDYDLLLGRDLQTFVHYRNTGTNQNPAWTLNTTTFSGIEAQTYWKNPTFVDLDYDGDMDLVYGQSSGILYVYRNNGTPDSPYSNFIRIILE